MSFSTAASYGMPPLMLADASVGSTPSVNPLAHPAKRFGFGLYAVILIGVAILYFWKGRK